jgi:mRNA-degrading endonuclease RelE of RelBE toxin-antitoxin system
MATERPPYVLVITDRALEDLRYLHKNDRATVMDAMDEQLQSQPLTPTRNRKPLRPNELASWQIRVGCHRVFYDVDEAQGKVFINAIGWKEHNKLFIRGKEYQL